MVGSFQWASRALPGEPEHTALPYEAILGTFTALSDSASDDVQRGAVGAVMDIASKSDRPGFPMPLTLASDDKIPQAFQEQFADPAAGTGEFLALAERRLMALKNYVDATAGTAADSPATRKRLLDSQVTAALIGAGFPLRFGRAADPDFIVEIGTRRIGIDVRQFRDVERSVFTRSLLHQQQSYLRGGLDAALLVSNANLRLPAEAADTGVHVFQWKGMDEDAARLVQRITKLARETGTQD